MQDLKNSRFTQTKSLHISPNALDVCPLFSSYLYLGTIVVNLPVMGTDYYCENIPVTIDEEEIIELLPISKPSFESSIQNNDLTNNNLIIETETDILGKCKSDSIDFETKIKNNLLFKHTLNTKTYESSSDLEMKKKNRFLRFMMLENELRALMIEIDNDKEDDEKPLRDKIDVLIGDVENFKISENKDNFIHYWENKLNNVKSNGSDHREVSNKNIKKETANQAITTNREYDLESRITNLERQMGSVPLTSSTPSLTDIIQDLYTRTNLILDGGDSVKNIETEILKQIENCEIYIKNSKRIKDKSEIVPLTDKKLCLLYEKVKKLPDFSDLLKTLIERFQYLNDLIINTSNTVSFMNGLESELNTIEAKLDSWDSKLSDLETQLDNDRSIFDSAIKGRDLSNQPKN